MKLKSFAIELKYDWDGKYAILNGNPITCEEGEQILSGIGKLSLSGIDKRVGSEFTYESETYIVTEVEHGLESFKLVAKEKESYIQSWKRNIGRQ